MYMLSTLCNKVEESNSTLEFRIELFITKLEIYIYTRTILCEFNQNVLKKLKISTCFYLHRSWEFINWLIIFIKRQLIFWVKLSISIIPSNNNIFLPSKKKELLFSLRVSMVLTRLDLPHLDDIQRRKRQTWKGLQSVRPTRSWRKKITKKQKWEGRRIDEYGWTWVGFASHKTEPEKEKKKEKV